MTAIKENPKAYQYASKELQTDPEIMKLVLERGGIDFGFLDFQLRENKEIVITAIKKDINNLKFTSNNLRKDGEFMVQACKKDGRALEYILDLHDNIPFIWQLCKIQSEEFDNLRQEFIDDFFALEKIKILGALIIAAIGGLLLSNLMIDSSLATLIVGITLTSLSGLYLMNKAYQHGMGFFKKPDDDAVKIQVNPISAS
jgi:hypothetical protein